MKIGDQEITIDSSVLGNHFNELDEVFRIYIEDINTFIIRFETVENEFPIEVQNEIRAIYGHLIRATMSTDETIITENIRKMKSHSKRALLDCFKYTSIALADEYTDFMKRYSGVDLTFIENGEFLRRIVDLYNRGREKLQNAKRAETSNLKSEELYELYQNAYNEFEKLHMELAKAEESAAFLEHKASRKDKITIASFIVGVLGIIVGIVGILL